MDRTPGSLSPLLTIGVQFDDDWRWNRREDAIEAGCLEMVHWTANNDECAAPKEANE